MIYTFTVIYTTFSTHILHLQHAFQDHFPFITVFTSWLPSFKTISLTQLVFEGVMISKALVTPVCLDFSLISFNLSCSTALACLLPEGVVVLEATVIPACLDLSPMSPKLSWSTAAVCSPSFCLHLHCVLALTYTASACVAWICLASHFSLYLASFVSISFIMNPHVNCHILFINFP